MDVKNSLLSGLDDGSICAGYRFLALEGRIIEGTLGKFVELISSDESWQFDKFIVLVLFDFVF